MNRFSTFVNNRESCRNFSTATVEKEKILAIVEAARLAPSACNAQPWHFHVITNPILLKPVAKSLQGMKMNSFTGDVPCFIVIQEGETNASAAFGAKIKHQDYTANDIGLATANICYAALDLGLSTCIVGWFSQKELKEALSITDNKPIRLVIALGYPKENTLPKSKKRKPLEEISTFYE